MGFEPNTLYNSKQLDWLLLYFPVVKVGNWRFTLSSWKQSHISWFSQLVLSVGSATSIEDSTMPDHCSSIGGKPDTITGFGSTSNYMRSPRAGFGNANDVQSNK